MIKDCPFVVGDSKPRHKDFGQGKRTHVTRLEIQLDDYTDTLLKTYHSSSRLQSQIKWEPPFSTMANAGISRALPKFLLPRLSWQTAPATTQHNTIRAICSTSASYHSSRDSQPRRPTTRKHGTIRPRISFLHEPKHHRVFHATARRSRDHHFDTLKFVQRLQEEGFTEAQSVAMMKVLSDVIEERHGA